MKYNVDFVYIWVDDQDPLWQAKKSQASNDNYIEPAALHTSRYINNDELLYSLRSVFQNCPWFHKIYIVTDNQGPKWLSTNEPRIEIIDHKTIFGDLGTLPCFNSNALESRLHMIPNLSEHYITMNDDFFIGKPLSKSFFFHDDGTPKYYLSVPAKEEKLAKAVTEKSRAQQSLYHGALNHSRQLVYETYNTLILSSPKHTPRPFRKSDVRNIEKTFSDIVHPALHHQFRSREGVHFIALCIFAMIAQGAPITETRYWSSRKSTKYLSYRDYIKISLGHNTYQTTLSYFLIRFFKPAFFCINDNERATKIDRQKMQQFLQQSFPLKERFENA